MENGTGARHEEHLLVMTSLKDAPHFVHRQAFPVGIGGEKLIGSARGFEVKSHAFRQRLEVGLREAQFFQGDGIAAMALEEILLRIKSRPEKATLRGIGHRHESLRRGSRRCRRELHAAPSLWHVHRHQSGGAPCPVVFTQRPAVAVFFWSRIR